eukprot:TRINITY_DN30290_c0_g1_i1.p1 TRINITY_DN30290_c0_g1~~TRINITY_DN30290_c0_g1_i1.p1  ORF type:complete len:260 (-),score=58.34 TRINITY_DN30290_c0_g1_i1:63-842(-)
MGGKKRQAVGDAGTEGAVFVGEGHPLLTALFQGDAAGALKLLEDADAADAAAGARLESSVAAVDQQGWSALHRAAFGGHDAVVRRLLALRAGVAAMDNEGVRPLHVAASSGHAECCRLLLDAGASPAEPDCHGLTVLDYAAISAGGEENGPSELQKLLQSRCGGETGVEPACLDSETLAALEREAATAAEVPFERLLELNPEFAAWLRESGHQQTYAEAWTIDPLSWLAQVRGGGYQIRLQADSDAGSGRCEASPGEAS